MPEENAKQKLIKMFLPVLVLAAEAMVTGDEYRFVRDAYLQRREYLVADGLVYDEWDEF